MEGKEGRGREERNRGWESEGRKGKDLMQCLELENQT